MNVWSVENGVTTRRCRRQSARAAGREKNPFAAVGLGAHRPAAFLVVKY